MVTLGNATVISHYQRLTGAAVEQREHPVFRVLSLSWVGAIGGTRTPTVLPTGT